MSNILQGIVYLTPEQYEALVNDGHITANGKTIAYNKNTLYITKAANSDGTTSNVDLSGYYTKEEVDDLIANIELPEPVDLTNYYTKEESDANYLGANTTYLASIGSAFYDTAQGLSVKDNTGAETGLFLEKSDFSFVAAGPHPNMRRVASLKDVVRTNVDQEVSGNTNFTGGLQKNGVDVATVDDITFDGDYNSLTNKPEIPSVVGLATETYVDTQIAALIDSAPETRNTLKELSDAIQENDTVIDTLNSAIGSKASQAALDSLAETVTSNKKAADLINELCTTGTNAGIETGWVYADTFAYRNPLEGGTGVIDIKDKIYTDIVDYLPNIFYTKAILDNKITGQSLGGENMLPHDIYFVPRDEYQAGTDHVATTTKDGSPYVIPMQVGVEYSFDYTYGDESGTVTATTIELEGVAVITELAIPGLTDTEGNATTVMIVGDTSVMGMDVATTYFNVTDPTGIDMSCCPQKRLTITKMYVGGGTDQLGPMIKDVDNLVNYYTKTEIDSKIPTVPTAVSQLTNDAGFITDYTEADPTVPSHVKAITEANITSWNNKVESSTLDNYSLTTHNHDTVYSKLNHSHAYSEITGTPTLSTVATSGSYNDLTDKPTIPNTSNFITKDVNNLTNYTTTTALNTLLSKKADAYGTIRTYEINYIFTGNINNSTGV